MPKTLTINQEDLREAVTAWLVAHDDAAIESQRAAEVADQLWAELAKQPVQT
jgi:hypothetical protein